MQLAGLLLMPLGIVRAETGGTLGEGLLIAAVGFLLVMIGRSLRAGD